MKKSILLFIILVSMTFVINTQNNSSNSLAQLADQEATTLLKP